MTTIATIESEVAEIIEQFEHDCYGLRSDDRKFEVGESLGFCSRRYADGIETDDIHDGVSATMIDGNNSRDSLLRALASHCVGSLAAPANRAYSGKYLYVLGSDSCEAGEDANETIMDNPVVVAVFEK